MIPRIHGRTGRLLLCAIATVSLTAAADSPKQMDMRVDGRNFDKEALQAERKAYHDWLVSERVAAARDNALVVQASKAQIDAVDSAPEQFPEIVGFSQDVSVDISFRDVKLARLRGNPHKLAVGAVEATSDGGYVYTAEISSPGAVGLRVQFAGFSLPTGAGLYLNTADGQAFGPYTGRGPLGNGQFDSNTLAGDTVTLQLRQVAPASQQALRDTRFQIVGLGHIRPRFMEGQCSYNAECVVSAACDTSSAVTAAANAVAHMLFRSGGSYYICSGGLINDTDTSNSLPLFLTANHCISRGRDANTLENFFQFAADSCNNATADCLTSYSQLRIDFPRTLGASIVSTGRDADYTLLRLAQGAPNGSAFLGWNEAPVAFSNGVDLFRISHPGGAPQSYSEHEVDANAPTCQSWPRGNRIYSRDVVGATEGGSSGSPVVNSAGQIVGQLSGACGTNVNDNCDADNNATVDGAFAAYFSSVEQYLDPDGGSGCTPTGPTESNCSDGVDNDCDGDTDGDDPDCGTGGLPSGAACTDNSDCASNNCKGKPGQKTCK
jgi:V8-like Glu-specific endopeptidase